MPALQEKYYNISSIPIKKKRNVPRKAEGNIVKVEFQAMKRNQASTMECLYSRDEILAVYSVFKFRVENADTTSKQRIARRNLTMFVCAINIGLRGGDFCSLKWSDIFNPDWTFKVDARFTPQKTSKYKKKVDLIWNRDFEIALTDWLQWLQWKNNDEGRQKLDDYIFTAQKKHKDRVTGEEKESIDSKSWWRIMETARKEAGIKQKIGTHGCRKTMVNQYIKNSEDKSKGLMEMSSHLKHSDIRTTEIYACLDRENIRETKQKMSFIYQ